MKIAIISGGSIQEEFASGFLSNWKPDRVIAADRGMVFCRRSGMLPDVLVGDFDSLPAETAVHALAEAGVAAAHTSAEADVAATHTLEEADGTDRYGRDGLRDSRLGEQLIETDGKIVRIIRHCPEKDATDTALAVEEAIKAGADEVLLLGATGTRLDHVWGNLSLMYRLRQRGIRAWIVDEHNRISMPAEKRIRLRRETRFGTYVSVLPYGGPVEGLTLTGFRYPLSGYSLKPGGEPLCISNEIEEPTAYISYTAGTPVIIESRD